MLSVYKTYYYSKAQPGLLAYFLLFGLLGFLGLIMLVLIVFSEVAHQQYRLSNFKVRLLDPKSNLADLDLTKIASPRFDFLSALHLPLIESVASTIQEHRTAIGVLASMYADSQNNRFEELSAKLERIINKVTPASAAPQELWAEGWLPVLTEIRELSRLGEESLLTRARLEAREMDKREELSRIKQRFDLIAADASELFNLNRVVTDNGSSDLPIYRAGVLIDIPKLEGLSDGLIDLAVLKVELALAGGSVSKDFSEPNAFSERLQQIRNAVVEVDSEYRFKFKERVSVVEEMRIESKNLKNFQERITGHLKRLMALELESSTSDIERLAARLLG